MTRKIVTCFVIHSFAIIIGIIITISGKKECHTEDCRNYAEAVKVRLSKDTDPCEDFYTFACGKIIGGSSYKGQEELFKEINNKTASKLVAILISPHRRSEPRYMTLGKALFSQCVKNESDKVIANNVKLFIEVVGGFPTVDGDRWDESYWHLEKSLGALKGTAILQISLKTNPFNTSDFILFSSNPRFLNAICDDEICQENNKTNYINMAVKLGADREEAAKDAEEVTALDSQLYTISKISAKERPGLRDYIYHTRTMDNFTSTYDFIDWNMYFEYIFGRIPEVSKKSFIIVLNDVYLRKLKEILNSTSKRTLANYIAWSNLLAFKYLPGREPSENRCLLSVMESLPIVTNVIAFRVSPKSAEPVLRKMVENIRNDLLNRIEDSDWIDEETMRRAEEKIKRLGINIGYIKLFLDDDLVNEYYKTLTIGRNFLESLLNVNRHTRSIKTERCYFKSSSDKLCQLLVASNTDMLKLNALNNLVKNAIFICAPILQPPLFHEKWPKYINYGRMGMAIGHEISHALDSTGAKFDDKGNVRNWWSDETYDRFKERTTCFATLYSGLTYFDGVEMKTVDGSRTKAENIADVTGLQISVDAYKTIHRQRFLPELLLPDLEYNQEQLFYISTAGFWCEKFANYEELHQDYGRFSFNHYVPNHVRVTGMMMNSPTFSEAFNCKVGAKMNPSEKCSIL